MPDIDRLIPGPIGDAKRTPGPWKYNLRDNADPQLREKAPLVIYHDESEEPGRNGGCEVVIAQAETEPDARFIAAAPEMFRGCQMALLLLEEESLETSLEAHGDNWYEARAFLRTLCESLKESTDA